MKVALVHEYLSQYGGAEKVLEVLQKIHPEAPTFVMFHDKNKVPEHLLQGEIYTSFLQYFPLIKSHYRWYLPLMPLAVEHLNLSDYDVIISSTSAFGKGVITSSDALHISYCHTPTRYLWTDTHNYIEELSYNKLIKFFLPPLISRLRLWDRMSAERVDYFIANSENVRRRIQKYYHRDAEVIYPPVDTNLFKPTEKISDYFLTGGRLVPYKRFDLTIKVFNRLGWPLKIFGSGPEEEKLKEAAKSNIEFLGNVSDQKKSELYAKALAFIHPQIEDLGITAIESMAAGRPVIAFAGGGALETIKDGVTGIFFHEQTWENLFDTILHFNPSQFDSLKIREQAEQFSLDNFKQKMKIYINGLYADFKKGWKQPELTFSQK